MSQGREPDIEVRVWVHERMVTIESPFRDSKEQVVRALRKIADRIEESDTTGIHLN